MAKRFSRAFFRQDSVTVARQLLGASLHRVIDGVELIGKIVETEAYTQHDPASHSFRGLTERTKPMFLEGGYSYVYFTYGMYYCCNVSTNEEGIGEAVLIRALEPLAGIEMMKQLRPKAKNERELTNGPGKLCQAFGIDKRLSGLDLLESDEFFLTPGKAVPVNLIGVSTRIGISVAVHEPWRFFLKENPFVSKGKPSGG